MLSNYTILCSLICVLWAALQKCLFIMLMILLVTGESIRSSKQDRPLWTFQMEKHLILDSSGLFWSQRCFIVVLGNKINHWGNDYNFFNWIILTKWSNTLRFLFQSHRIFTTVTGWCTLDGWLTFINGHNEPDFILIISFQYFRFIMSLNSYDCLWK